MLRVQSALRRTARVAAPRRALSHLFAGVCAFGTCAASSSFYEVTVDHAMAAAARAAQVLPTHKVTVEPCEGDEGRPMVILEPRGSPVSGLLVISHGLGDTAMGWLDAAVHVFAPAMPYTRIVLPTAATRPVTLNGGMPMPAWYDIRSLAADRSKERSDGIQDSRKEIEAIVARFATEGDEPEDGKVPHSRVVLAGFSQGAALSLFTAMQSSKALAGCLVLSGYLPALEAALEGATDAGKTIPVHFCHGDSDGVVLPEWGADALEQVTKSREGFEGAGAVSRKVYAGLDHGANMKELRDALAVVQGWLR
ncbi:hypothetical protein FNF27_05857 [Cafeteria roenbergensis]|uniref:Phospholipase/carboxylesterase/thioesterase domain-containing protein n=1 Tax=Cafeteria roenbergensis TaxID=33653 RepID=A0A5A8E4L5_CAFRO|nr:hypothetical protein FNF27_05857 [Cafeteria roenbergensis]